MYQNNSPQLKNKKTISWKYILFLCIFCFPLGFYFAYSKLLSERDQYIRNGLIFSAAGLLLSGFMAYRIGRFMPGGGFNLRIFIGQRDRLTLPFFFLMTGLFVFVTGCFFALQGRRDRLLFSYLTEDHILDLEDLCLLLHTTPARCFDRLERLLDTYFQKDTLICYQTGKPVLIPREERRPALCVSDYLENPAFQEPLPRPLYAPEPSALVKWLRKNKVPSLVNFLWIAGAVTGCLAGFFLLPAGLLITVFAAIMERKKYLRKNPCIMRCAVFGFIFISLMTGIIGISTLSPDGSGSGGILVFAAYLPCLLLVLAEISAYVLFERRARRYYRFIYLSTEERHAVNSSGGNSAVSGKKIWKK